MLNSLAAVFHSGRGFKCPIEKFNPVVDALLNTDQKVNRFAVPHLQGVI